VGPVWLILLSAETSEPAPTIQNMSNPRKASTDIRRGVATGAAGATAVGGGDSVVSVRVSVVIALEG